MGSNNIIAEYMEYVTDTEPPYIYHRWSAICSIGALLGRSCYIQHGHFRVYPNLYTMLIGDPATRKSTAIKISKKIITGAGYDTFAADKTSKEKFLLDLEGETLEFEEGSNKTTKYDAVLAENLWGSKNLSDPKEVFIAADEWSEFAKPGDLEFYTTLGNLWDWDSEKPFSQRFKNSKSVSIFQPTVSLLGGTTPELFSKSFPADALGSGFLSRMILIHGMRSQRKYTFPPIPTKENTDGIVSRYSKVRTSLVGSITIEPGAAKVLDDIYLNWRDINDVRFRSYSNRRFTQLLKLCLIITASRGLAVISAGSVIEANTYLVSAEILMPKALGEFGKSKNSDVVQKIMDVLKDTMLPMKAPEIWAHVHKDLEKVQMLHDIMNNLMLAKRVHFAPGAGWLPVGVKAVEHDYVEFEKYLTDEERKMI